MVSRRRPEPDCYDYVRRYYGVPAYIGMRVRAYGREGVLVKSRGDQYVYILLDGDTKARGPYHPTDTIEYFPFSTTPNGTPAHDAVGKPASDTSGAPTREG